MWMCLYMDGWRAFIFSQLNFIGSILDEGRWDFLLYFLFSVLAFSQLLCTPCMPWYGLWVPFFSLYPEYIFRAFTNQKKVYIRRYPLILKFHCSSILELFNFFLLILCAGCRIGNCFCYMFYLQCCCCSFYWYSSK